MTRLSSSQITVPRSPGKKCRLIHLILVSTEESIEEVTENHPEVFAILEDTLRHAKELNFEQPHDKQAEILEEVIKEVKFLFN
jgi:hypothetical protein